MKCPICNCTNTKKYFRLYDDRYGYDGDFDLLKCSACEHIFVSSRFSDHKLVRLYTDFYPRRNFDVHQHRPHKISGSFITWLNGDMRSAYRWVPQNVRVLDIGCGLCESLAYHQTRGCEVYGVEADENVKKIVVEHRYNVHVGLFNPNIYRSEFFDYITMDQVLEHVVNPLETLNGIVKILKPKGKLILSVPNPQGYGVNLFGKRWINWHAPYHLHHFSINSILIAAKSTGLKVVQIKTCTSSDWLYFQWKHLISFPMKGKPSDFWAGTNIKKLSNLKKILYIFAWLFHKLKINHILTRIFDGLKLGDSRLFILEKQ